MRAASRSITCSQRAPAGREAVGERLGVGTEVGRRVEAALDEPHDAAVDEIDGGDDVHAVTVQNLLERRVNVLACWHDDTGRIP